MGGRCNMYRGKEKYIQNVSWKTIKIGLPGLIVLMDVGEVDCEYVNWIDIFTKSVSLCQSLLRSLSFCKCTCICVHTSLLSFAYLPSLGLSLLPLVSEMVTFYSTFHF
jgi:hypothetical protein